MKSKQFWKYLIILLFLTLLVYLIISYSKDETYGDLSPAFKGEIIEHTYFKLAYAEEHEQAYWVFYRLTPEFLNSSISRTDDFRPDLKVSTESASLGDYRGTGYDRGHLCPAADMKINTTGVSESFFMSNMSPQVPAFNRGIWSQLENQVRNWAMEKDSIYVVTGPVFRDNLGSIGDNNVTVPGYYFKAIFDRAGKKMIAFVLPNQKIEAPLHSFVITVDSLETLTGIDFFPGIPDRLERRLQRKSDISRWKLSSSSTALKKKTDVAVEPFSKPNQASINETITPSTQQCMGTAKSTGLRCKNKTSNTNGFCNQHQNQAPK